jgi:hypothetical protein
MTRARRARADFALRSTSATHDDAASFAKKYRSLTMLRTGRVEIGDRQRSSVELCWTTRFATGYTTAHEQV